MGVQGRVVVFAPDEERARDLAVVAFERIAELEAIMTDYRPDSELMRFCAAAGSGFQPLSADLFAVLDRSRQIAEQTEGAFDPTVGPLVRLWRAARKSGVLPDPAAIETARALTGWQHLHLDPARRAGSLDLPGMSLDLGAIGKGFACEEAVARLRAQGGGRCLVALAGDIVCGDPPPGEAGWSVGIGARGGDRSVLANRAVSTSGDTQQFVEIGGRRYSHVVDPATGLGLTSRWEFSVTAPDGATADAISTAACVLGPERFRAIEERFPGIEPRFLSRADAGP